MSSNSASRSNLVTQMVLIIAIIAVVGAFQYIHPSAADVQVAEPMALYDYEQIQELRVELALTNRDLAAMGCSRTQAESILIAARQWYFQNKNQREQFKSEAAELRRQLRLVDKNIRTGSYGTGVQGAEGVKKNLLLGIDGKLRQEKELALGLATAIEALMPEETKQAWRGMRESMRRWDMKYVPDVTAAQVAAIGKAKEIHGGNDTAFRQSLDGILSGDQKAKRSSAQAKIEANIHHAELAESTVMPKPAIKKIE